jgi:hypothetical protein
MHTKSQKAMENVSALSLMQSLRRNTDQSARNKRGDIREIGYRPESTLGINEFDEVDDAMPDFASSRKEEKRCAKRV